VKELSVEVAACVVRDVPLVQSVEPILNPVGKVAVDEVPIPSKFSVKYVLTELRLTWLKALLDIRKKTNESRKKRFITVDLIREISFYTYKPTTNNYKLRKNTYECFVDFEKRNLL
jgi:hypothetical protein